MPRRSGVIKRDVLPDPLYGSKVITKLINQIMLDGKRGTAQTVVFSFLFLAKRTIQRIARVCLLSALISIGTW